MCPSAGVNSSSFTFAAIAPGVLTGGHPSPNKEVVLLSQFLERFYLATE